MSASDPGAPLPIAALIADDEKNIRLTLAACLQGLGCRVAAVDSIESALLAASQQAFDLAFLDLRLGNQNGLDLLPRLLAERPNLSVVVITAHASFDTAVEAIKRGAADYLPKPFTPDQVEHVVQEVMRRRDMLRRLEDLGRQVRSLVPEVDLATRSPKMQSALEMASRAAASSVPILLCGENGTGKTVLARLVHERSPRRDRPFVVVNCPTLSDELLSSELFGHAKGAFTGAVRDQPGRVESAEGGTLFLDEVGEISSALQAKLLRFVQDKQFERLGEGKTRTADVRIVSATNRDLQANVAAGKFREDLWHRLNVIEVSVPPLRERREDILPLAESFLAFFGRSTGRAGLELSPSAQALLHGYDWPGNVRELRNAIERAVILWPARILEPQAFPERMVSHASAAPRIGDNLTLDEIERLHTLAVLSRTATLDEAATILGIDPSTLYRKRKKFES
jgi:NtrC-family two-component system response regulator AlgB